MTVTASMGDMSKLIITIVRRNSNRTFFPPQLRVLVP